LPAAVPAGRPLGLLAPRAGQVSRARQFALPGWRGLPWRRPQRAPLLLGGAAPDAVVLVMTQRPVQARGAHRAGQADPPGLGDLRYRGASGANREEEVRVAGAAGRMAIEGSWAGKVVGLDDMRSEIAMMRIPGAPGRLELAKYHAPKAITPKPDITPANTLGLHRVMFAVDDIEDTLARLRPHGAELVGEVTRFEDSFLLCYLRGPSGIIFALAEQLR
jgi:catechol 2,3-dioxygenase-like lactoylglutathione lyase family enzyme